MRDTPTLIHLAQVLAAAVRRTSGVLRGAWRAFPAAIHDELIMCGNRLTAGVVMLGAVAVSAADHGDLAFPHWLEAIGGWTALGLALFVHTLAQPRFSIVRRSLAMVLDVTGASIMLHVSGAATAFIYPVYLWIILGYGLRFGGRYVLAASALSIVGFGLVIATTPFWQAEPRTLVGGLIAGLVVLPTYSYVLVRRLAAARRAAEQANRAKSLFLAGVSHELRTPLNAITGTAEVLQTTRLDGDQSSMIASIDASADALLSMIVGLLDVARIEAGQLHLSPVAFDPAQLLVDVHRIVGVQAAAKNLVFNTFITARTPSSVRGDAARLREVLLSLCSNAVKFTSHGSITVAVDGEMQEDGRVHLRAEVDDTGIGIPAAAQTRIFEMFTQSDESIASRFGGTGIGLAICNGLVRLLGGELGVVSEPDRGSTFWFTVPVDSAPETEGAPALGDPVRVLAKDPQRAASLAARLGACGIDAQLSSPVDGSRCTPSVVFVDAGDDSAATRLPPEARVAVLVASPLPEGLPPPDIREHYVTAIDAAGPDASLCRAAAIVAARLAPTRPSVAARAARRPGSSGVRVLVADDNGVNRRVVTRILEHSGHEVVTTSDGEQALDILSSGEVDIAILDVNMPLLSGIEVARLHLYSAPPEARLPVLGLTADGTPETRAQCMAAGMAACLVKPLRSLALLDALDQALETRGQTRGDPRPMVDPPAGMTPALDLQALADLVEVGGEAFVVGIVRDFIQETEETMTLLKRALTAGDLTEFRAQAHALCSSAANVGARGLRELCYPWQTISASELEQAGPDMLHLLNDAWLRSKAALLEHAA